MSLLAICSCSGNRYGENVFRPQIVVEGSIDSGEPAVVVLTQMLPYGSDTEEGPLNMKEIVIRWATVSLSDGERSEMLVGKIDTNYTPPYIYAGSSIRGEPGKKYTLTVKYSGRTLTAETVVPEPVPIRKYEVIPSQTNDTLYSIKIYFEDNPERKDYYKVFAKVKNSDNRYFPAFMGNLSDVTTASIDASGDSVKTLTLENLGFVAGGSVTVVAAFQGNIIVNVKEARVAISEELARKIMI